MLLFHGALNKLASMHASEHAAWVFASGLTDGDLAVLPEQSGMSSPLSPLLHWQPFPYAKDLLRPIGALQ